MRFLQSKLSVTSWLFLALIGSSLEPVLVKLFNFPISPIQLMGLKSICGSIIILPAYKQIKKIPKEFITSLTIISFLAFLTNTLIFFSLQTIPASILITIISSTPALVSLINYKQGKVEISTKFIYGFSISFLGVIFTVNSFPAHINEGFYTGIFFAIASVICSAAYRIKVDNLSGLVAPLSITTFIFLVNGIASLFLISSIEFSVPLIKFGFWLGLAGLLANIAFISAIHIIGSTRVSILTLIQRPIVIILGVFTLNEYFKAEQVLGMLMILIGVYFSKAKKKQIQFLGLNKE